MANWDWPDSTVTRIIDGDSLVAEVHRDLGFNGTATFRQKLRLNRINAKPAKTPEGKAATAAVVGMVTDPVHITTLKAYKFGSETGEWMAEVTLVDGRNLSDALVGLGLAVLWDGTGPRPD
jgi:endonuclease YncB( thermonuclease family)